MGSNVPTFENQEKKIKIEEFKKLAKLMYLENVKIGYHLGKKFLVSSNFMGNGLETGIRSMLGGGGFIKDSNFRNFQC